MFPCTWYMNKKAGMNAVKLEKYFIKLIFPLYPDVEDVAKKSQIITAAEFILLSNLLNSNYARRLFPIVVRVIIKVDSGPG